MAMTKIWRDSLCKMAHFIHRRLQMAITGYNWFQVKTGLFRITSVIDLL